MIITVTGSSLALAEGGLPYRGRAEAMMAGVLERKEADFNSSNVATFTIVNGDNKEIESYGFTESDIDEQRDIKVTAKTNTSVTVKCTGSDADAANLRAFIVLRPAVS